MAPEELQPRVVLLLTEAAPSAGSGDAGAPGGPGGVDPAVTDTLSNVDVFSTDVLWLVTSSPMTALDASDAVVLPTVRQVDPSAETDPVNVDPDRDNFSQAGGA